MVLSYPNIIIVHSKSNMHILNQVTSIIPFDMKNLLVITTLCVSCISLSAQSDSLQIKISDLSVSKPTVEKGKSISFSFKLKNTGLANLPPEFPGQCELGARLSKDTIFDFDDLNVVYFSYNLLAPGEECTYQSDFFAPASVDTGKYFLLVYSNFGYCYNGDPNDQTVIYTPLKIVPFTGLPCTKKIAGGNLECTFYDAGGNFNFITSDGNVYKSYRIDTSGAVHPNPDPVVPETFYCTIEQGQLVKKSSTGAVIFTKNIPAPLIAGYNQLKSAIEFGSGFVIAAFKNPPYYPAPNAPNTANLGLTLIVTDNNLNVLTTKEWNSNTEGAPFLYNFDNQRFALGYSSGTNVFGNGYILVLDAALTVISSKTVLEYSDASGGWGLPVPGFRKTLCGEFLYSYYYHSSYLPFGQTIKYDSYYSNFNGTELVPFKSFSTNDFQNSYSTTNSIHFIRTVNGQTLEAEGSFYASYSQPGFIPTTTTISEVQNNMVLLEQTLSPSQLYPFTELIKLAQKYYLLDQHNGDITLTPVDCNNNEIFVVNVPEMADNPSGISVFPNPGGEQFYIAGVSAACNVSLFDLMGKMILRQQLTPDATNMILFRPGCIPSGTYVLHVSEKNTNRSIKLIVR